MDDIQNAINEGRQDRESGENVWLPSAPQLSPEKTPEETPAQSPRGDETTTEALEQKSTTEQKILISRFTVNRIPVNFPAGDAKEVTFHSPLTSEDHEVVEGKGTLASPHATPGTTTVTTTTSAPPTTPTTPTASQATNTEDGEKTLGVAGTQTVDMEHQTGEKAATTVALLQEVVKELKTMLALSPSKENRKRSPLVKLRLHKYCAFCCLAVVFLCLFGFCMWMLSTLSFDVARQHENLDPNSIDTLEWLEQEQIREKSGILSKEEVSGLAAKVPGNAEIEGSSDSQEMQKPSLSTEETDTDEVVELVGEDKLETKAVESMEDKLMEEDTEETTLRPGGIEHEQLEDMDSHTLDGEETRNAVDIRPKILKVIHLKAQQCQQGGEVFLASYVDMYRHLLNFFHIFGTFASVQGRMLEARLLSLERYIRSGDGQHYSTLAAMIHFEDAIGRIGRISPFSGTTLFTCLQRHLQFMSRCLANVLPLSPDTSLLRAFQAAYQEVLAVHHEWFVENFYQTGIGMLPTKEAALQGVSSIEGDGDDTSTEVLHSSILAVVRVLHQVTEASEVTLVSTNALQKIPKQVVT